MSSNDEPRESVLRASHRLQMAGERVAGRFGVKVANTVSDVVFGGHFEPCDACCTHRADARHNHA